MRPTKYTDETCGKARDYIENYRDQGDMIPSVVGLAKCLGTHRETIRAWGLDEDKEEFSGILGEIQSEQERTLLNNGLSGEFNAAITKLALGKHGYHDKHDSTHSGPDGGPVQVIERTIIRPKDTDS